MLRGETPPTPETRAEIAGILIDNAVDVNAENNQGKKALDSCVGLYGAEFQPKMIRKLIDKGADVTSQMLLNVDMPFGTRSWAIPADSPYWSQQREVRGLISAALTEQQRKALLEEIRGVVNEQELEKIISNFVPNSLLLSDKDLTDRIPPEKKRDAFMNELKGILNEPELVKVMHDFVPKSKVSSRKKPWQSEHQGKEGRESALDGAAAAAGAGGPDQSRHTQASTAHTTPKPPSPRAGRGRG